MKQSTNNQFYGDHFLKLLPIIEEEDDRCLDAELNIFDKLVYKKLYWKTKTQNNFADSLKVYRPSNPYKEITNMHEANFFIHSYELHINCMINSKIKQSNKILKTDFVKKFLNAKNHNTNYEINEDNSSFNSSNEWVRFEKSDGWQDPDSYKKSFTTKRFYKNNHHLEKNKSDYYYPFSCRIFNVKQNRIFINNTSDKTKNQSRKEENIKKNCKSPKITPLEIEKKIEVEGKESKKQVQFIENIKNVSPIAKQWGGKLKETIKSIFYEGSKSLICKHCKETFVKLSDLVRHKTMHEEEKQMCIICGKLFTSTSNFIGHLLTHESVDKFSCKNCRKYFPTFAAYEKHVKKFHFKEEFLTLYLKPKAKSSSQGDIKLFDVRYECQRCRESFSGKIDFQAHMKLHVDISDLLIIMDHIKLHLYETTEKHKHLNKLVCINMIRKVICSNTHVIPSRPKAYSHVGGKFCCISSSNISY